jgi:UDP-glucose 4-epimerase
MTTDMGRDVLVTGGCGYIGSALVPQLQDAPEVASITILDDLSMSSPQNLMGSGLGTDQHLRFRRGDVTEYGDVESAVRGCDTVIHLAAITGAASTHDRRDETFRVNYGGTENVLRAAGKFDIDNVVFASSCNLYGRAPTENIDETTEPDPLNPYAESKYEAEQLLREAVDAYGFDATALRMSTNFGYSPGVRFNLVVNHFVFRALTDRPLTVYGDGSNWRPFIHVEDAARAYAHAARFPEQWAEPVYNVGSQEANYQITEIAEAVRKELDRNLDITYLEDEHPGPSYHVDFGRLADTDFETTRTLEDGIRELATQFDSE